MFMYLEIVPVYTIILEIFSVLTLLKSNFYTIPSKEGRLDDPYASNSHIYFASEDYGTGTVQIV